MWVRQRIPKAKEYEIPASKPPDNEPKQHHITIMGDQNLRLANIVPQSVQVLLHSLSQRKAVEWLLECELRIYYHKACDYSLHSEDPPNSMTQ